MKNFSIEMLTKRRLPEIIKIEEASTASHRWDEKELIKYFNKENTVGLLLQNGIGTIGYCAFIIEKDRVSVDKLVIHSDYRRLKYGSALYEKIINGADNFSSHFSKIKFFNFFVEENDISSIKFFVSKSLPSKVAKKHYGEGQDAILFYLKK